MITSFERRTQFLFWIVCSLTLIATRVSAQTDTTKPVYGWQHGLIAGLNVSQVSYSHWTAGGTNSLNYLASINGKSVNDEPMTNLSTLYKFTFGQAKLGDQEIRKTDDELNVESVLTYKIGVHINPYGALSLITQFAPGYQYTDTALPLRVSGFFDPAYIKQSAGIGYKPSNVFMTRFGAALREIITNHYNVYADDPNTPEIEKTRIEGGLESVSELELPIEETTIVRAKLELFSPIKTMDRIVVHSQLSLLEKVSKYFTAELTGSVIEEPDISPYTQVKQGISLGIVYAIL